MAPLRAFPTFHLLLCLTLAFSTAFAPSLSIAQETAAAPAKAASSAISPSLDYVPDGAAVLAVLRPAQFFASPAAELLPTEVLQAAVQPVMGFDPLKIEELIISWSPPANYAVYLRSSERLAIPPGELTKHTAPGTINGKEYLKSANHLEPSFYSPDDNSILAAPDFIIHQLVEGKRTTPPAVLKQFTAENANDDIHVVVNMAMLRPLISMALWNAEIPPEFAAAKDIPGMISNIDLRLNYSHRAPSELIVVANHLADANRLNATFESLKVKVLDQMNREMTKDMTGDEPVEKATRAYQQRMNQKILDSLKLQQQDDRLTIFRSEPTGERESEMASVATIGVLVALLLPAVQAAREAARRNQSINNMKQLNLGLLNYESAHGSFPIAASFSDDGRPLLSWRVHLLPYLEQQELYDQFHLDEPWDSEHNKTLISKMPELFSEPSSKLDPSEGKTNYLGVLGEGYFFSSDSEPRSIADFEDGTSNTIALVQVDDELAQVWTQPTDWTPDPTNPVLGLGGLHPTIFLASFCDGSVKAVDNNIDVQAFQFLLTIDGDVLMIDEEE